MRGTLMLTGTAVAGAALVVGALFAVLTEGPRASVAHASGIDEAARELDLIRPARPKQASDFSVALLGGKTLELHWRDRPFNAESYQAPSPRGVYP